MEQGYYWGFSGPSVVDLNIQPASVYIRANQSLATGDSILFDIRPGMRYSYLYAPKECVDCRLRGGTNIKPVYYPAN